MAENLGMVRPGSTIQIPFNTFDSNDPSASVAIAAFVAGDIEVYKDGVATTRASVSGYTLLDTDGIDFDSHVGIGGISIDLSDNDTAGFWAAGSRYFVMIGPTTVDAGVVNFIAATFEIGYPDALLNTTIASLTSATQFILTDGPAEADVLIGCPVILHDVASKVQFAFGVISDYIVTTKEVFLAATPVGFTPVATDNVSILIPTDIHSVKGTIQTAGDLAALIVVIDGLVDEIKAAVITNAAGDDVAADIIALKTVADAIPTTAMRGTDNGALASVATEARLAELDAGNLPTDIAAIPTTAMRGTDNVVLAGPTKAEMDTAHGVLPTAAEIADAVQDEALEDHLTKGTTGWSAILGAYAGSDGPGIYIDSGASNTNTVLGTDGVEATPVSTLAAARTLADALGVKVYYLEGNSDSTIDATHEDWEFIGIGSIADNVVNLGSQDVDRSLFRNLTIEGTQGGTGRITARDCALQDPGAGTTTLHIFAERCGIVDDILVDTSADNVFDECFSLAASGVAPIITATGASGSIIISHYGGKLELKSLSASHNIELDGHGHITFNADCNVNATLDIHGIWDVTDNTAGMSDLTTTSGLVNMTKINTEADTALTDYDAPTKAEMDTAHALLATPAQVATELGTYDGPTKAEMDTGHGLLATEAKQDIIDGNVDDIETLVNALNDISVADILTTQMTEAYAANGVAPTLAEGIFAIHQMLMQFGIATTNYTVRKLDDSTTAFVVTLDNATLPTDAKRV